MVCISFLIDARDGAGHLCQFLTPRPFDLFFSGHRLEAGAVYSMHFILTRQDCQQKANRSLSH